ncbi:MAG: ribbon-helix-helix protein, CopG family [SAR324 cluster bacterium]|nr:ribbon-helix-helix protein, CopG family [SAR324 cluster bacterium]
MKNISLKIPEALNHQLSELATRQKKNKSELIREALERFIHTERPTSSLSVIKDLVGSIESAEDLSSNKEHLRKFGEK